MTVLLEIIDLRSYVQLLVTCTYHLPLTALLESIDLHIFEE